MGALAPENEVETGNPVATRTKKKTAEVPEPTGAEYHVRRYLQLLDDPQGLIDEEEVRAAKDALQDAEDNGDPIARVRAITAMERATQVDTEAVTQAFIAHLPEWLDDNPDVSVNALQSMGLPVEVLVEAGVLAPPTARRAGRRRTARTAGEGRLREPRISNEEAAAVLPVGQPFTTSEAAELFGRTVQTARNIVKRLVVAGIIENVGETGPRGGGKGAAAQLYQRVA